MANIETALGIFPKALKLINYRSEILGNNLVNQSTPGFRARDFDIASELGKLDAVGFSGVNTDAVDLQYRIASNPSVDGNTVDGSVEKAKYAENSLRYMAALNFLSKKVDNIMLALKGGSAA